MKQTITIDEEKIGDLLSKLGFPMKDYQEAGFSDIETMIDLSKRFKPKSGLYDDFSEKVIGDVFFYAKGGFSGDAKAMFELADKSIDGEFAAVLGEHRLGGDLESMVKIGELIGLTTDPAHYEDCFRSIAGRIADQLAGGRIPGSVRLYDDDPKLKLDEIRKEFADQIDPRHVALLMLYKLDNESVAWYKVHASKCLAEGTGDFELARKYANQRIIIEDKPLFDAYLILRDKGEEAFKSIYSLIDSFTYDTKGQIQRAEVLLMEDPLEQEVKTK